MTAQLPSRQQLVHNAINHVGYYDLHPDASINFQFNRWVQWLGESAALQDMQTVAPKIKTYADLRHEFLLLSEQALQQERPLAAAYYLRTAEFFVWADDPQKHPMRDNFIHLMRQCYGISENEQYQIPYQIGFLPAYRFTPQQSKATVVLFGGYDSYIEEFFALALTNVRSLTTRVFTRAEQAQNHVQVGNLGLSLRLIANWLDSINQKFTTCHSTH